MNSQTGAGGARPRTVLPAATLPLLAGLMNYMEDGLVLTLIHRFPARHDGLAALCGICTTTKSLLITLSLLITAGLYLRAAFRSAAIRKEGLV